MHPKDILIQDFTYALPDERIAAFPLAERDQSKLLVYKDGMISEDVYRNIAAYIPADSLILFNNTKVIQARILFQKSTGGMIEIFCLEPYETTNEYSMVMAKTGSVRWKCMIGGAGKWKSGPLEKTAILNGAAVTLSAVLVQRLPDAYVVELSWQPADYSFAAVLEVLGDMPLPPYIKRKADAADQDRYQTIYALHKGSVAAPTAGLHFTDRIFQTFNEKHIHHRYVTLHVGAGTFKPVKADSLSGHEMHSEWMDVTKASIEAMLANSGIIIAAGTTSLRTIESLYWMGVKALLQPAISVEELTIQQWDVYEAPLCHQQISRSAALTSLLQWMDERGTDRLLCTTQILIAPGYQYRIASAIITNFHQPQSTLLLLVSAAVGERWKTIYQYALDHDFRFLSYGDGSLLFVNQHSSQQAP